MAAVPFTCDCVLVPKTIDDGVNAVNDESALVVALLRNTEFTEFAFEFVFVGDDNGELLRIGESFIEVLPLNCSAS